MARRYSAWSSVRVLKWMNLAEFMRPCVWFGLAWPGAREATKAAQDRGGVSPVAACGCNYAIRVAKPVFGPLQRAQRGRRHSDDWFVHARAEGSPVQNSYAAQPECIYPGLPFKRCLAWKLHAAEASHHARLGASPWSMPADSLINHCRVSRMPPQHLS